MHIGPKDLIIGGNLPISVYPTHLNADRGFIADTFLGGKGFVEVTTPTYTVQDNDFFIRITYNGECTLTLPAPSLNKGRILIISSISNSKVYSDANNVYLDSLSNLICDYIGKRIKNTILISNGLYWYAINFDANRIFALGIEDFTIYTAFYYVLSIVTQNATISRSAIVDASNNNITITLTSYYHHVYFIKRIDGSNNIVNIIPSSPWLFEDNKSNISLGPMSAVILLSSPTKQRHYVYATYGTVTIS